MLLLGSRHPWVQSVWGRLVIVLPVRAFQQRRNTLAQRRTFGVLQICRLGLMIRCLVISSIWVWMLVWMMTIPAWAVLDRNLRIMATHYPVNLLAPGCPVIPDRALTNDQRAVLDQLHQLRLLPMLHGKTALLAH